MLCVVPRPDQTRSSKTGSVRMILCAPLDLSIEVNGNMLDEVLTLCQMPGIEAQSIIGCMQLNETVSCCL